MAKFLSCENTADSLLNMIAENPGLLARLQALCGTSGQVSFTSRVISSDDTSIVIPAEAKLVYVELTGGGGGGADSGVHASGGGGSGGETTWKLFRRSDFQTHVVISRTGPHGGVGQDGTSVAVYDSNSGNYLLQAKGGKKGTELSGGAAVGIGEGMGAAGGGPGGQDGHDSVKGGAGGGGHGGGRGGTSRGNDPDHGQGGEYFQEGKDFGGGGGFGASGGKPGVRVWTW